MRVKLVGLRTATKRLSDGSRRVYAYMGGECLAVGSGVSLEAANADLQARLAEPDTLARVAALQAPRAPVSTRFISGVVEAFYSSPEFKALGIASRREYRAYLDAFREMFGRDKVAMFERIGARSLLVEWRDTMWPDSSRAADYAMTAVSKLFTWARRREFTTAKPTADIERVHKTNRSDVIWTDGDLARFKAAATPQVWRVVALAAETGMRQGDLLNLTWASVGKLSISLRTSKTKAVVIIPLRQAARDLLGEIPRTSTHVLLTGSGKPWGSGFGASFQAARDRAGLKHLRFHDLRGTAATRLAAAGYSHADLSTILGWPESRVRDMLAIYVSGDELAARMLERIEQEHRPANRPQTGSVSSIADGRKSE